MMMALNIIRGRKAGLPPEPLRLGLRNPCEDRLEKCPVHDLVETRPRIAHGLSLFKPLGLVKEAGFIGFDILGHHPCILAKTTTRRQ